jgi:hypothetical protein
MQRGRTLFWMIIGSVVAAVAVVIALILVNSGTPPKAASSPVPPISASASSPAGKSAPVVIPATSSTSFSYLADLTPSGNLAEKVIQGPVKISGSIYPKSISFYCNNGDPAPTPAYKLRQNARRFNVTVGIAAKLPPHFEAAVSLIGDGRTLRSFNVSLLRPKTVNVNVAGVHTLQLECFRAGISPSGGWAVAVAWGNARVTEGH